MSVVSSRWLLSKATIFCFIACVKSRNFVSSCNPYPSKLSSQVVLLIFFTSKVCGGIGCFFTCKLCRSQSKSANPFQITASVLRSPIFIWSFYAVVAVLQIRARLRLVFLFHFTANVAFLSFRLRCYKFL